MAYYIAENCTSCGACIQWCPTRAIRGRRKTMVTIDASLCISCGACGRVCGHQAIRDDEGNCMERVRLLAWPKPEWNYEECTQCADCQTACPANCIAITQDDSMGVEPGFPYLARPKLCLACDFCSEACPTGAVQFNFPTLAE